VLNELKTAITAFIRNISPSDLREVFVNKIKRFRPLQTLVYITSNTRPAIGYIHSVDTGVLSRGSGGRRLKLTTDLHPVTGLNMSEPLSNSLLANSTQLY
jgi:hypothetical protein